MGRYYGGDIESTFWFGVQSCCDISNLVIIEYIQDYVCKVCNCNANVQDDRYCSE